MEQKSREDGSPDVPREHTELPSVKSYIDDTSHSRETETEKETEALWEEYSQLRQEQALKRISKEQWIEEATDYTKAQGNKRKWQDEYEKMKADIWEHSDEQRKYAEEG